MHMNYRNDARASGLPRRAGLCALALATALVCCPSRARTRSLRRRLPPQAESDALFQRIDALQTELNQANADYEAAVQSHDDAVEAMNAAQARIDSAEERIDELQVRLGDRANEMYKTGGSTSFVDVLLGASSFAEFLTSWDMIERITSQDAALIQESKDLRAEAQAAHDEHARQEQIASEEMQRSFGAEERDRGHAGFVAGRGGQDHGRDRRSPGSVRA